MKKISTLFFGLAMLSAFVTFGQAPAKKPATSSTSGSCFSEWHTLFRERGAKPVTDGTHEVIVTVRGEDNSECYLGKATVADGKIVPPLLVQKQDGSFESYATLGKKLDPSWVASQNKETIYEITDGMSVTFYTSDKEIGKIFFYTFVNDKPKANKKAPAPSALVKN